MQHIESFTFLSCESGMQTLKGGFMVVTISPSMECQLNMMAFQEVGILQYHQGHQEVLSSQILWEMIDIILAEQIIQMIHISLFVHLRFVPLVNFSCTIYNSLKKASLLTILCFFPGRYLYWHLLKMIRVNCRCLEMLIVIKPLASQIQHIIY